MVPSATCRISWGGLLQESAAGPDSLGTKRVQGNLSLLPCATCLLLSVKNNEAVLWQAKQRALQYMTPKMLTKCCSLQSPGLQDLETLQAWRAAAWELCRTAPPCEKIWLPSCLMLPETSAGMPK